jgi:hypothetical protein
MSNEPAVTVQRANATMGCDLESVICKFTDSLRRSFEASILQDPSGFKKRAVRLFRLSLPPGPGRPAEELITLAEQMRAHGVPWSEVYKKCVSPDLHGGARQFAMIRLRGAVRSRRFAERRKVSLPKT